MKTSTALSWATLVSKIHPPLPLTPKESRKLLQCLNTSFKKRLDSEYPFRLEDSSSHTQAHLKSILRSPLFEAKTPNRLKSSPTSSGNRDVAISVHALQYWLRKPLDAFQRGVSTGTASLETAKLCLELQLKKCLASRPANVPEGEEVSDTAGTGSAVLSWLWSSGMEESGQHLKDRQFISLLMPFLVIERHYDVIFNWFSRSEKNKIYVTEKASQRNVRHNFSTQSAAVILLELVKSEHLYGAGLGASMLHFNEYFHRRPTGPRSLSQGLFRPAGNFLTHQFAKPKKNGSIQDDILSSFIATSGEWAEEGRFTNVVLQVHHPKAPKPHLAVEYLNSLPAERIASLKVYQRHSLVLTSLKAAELLLARGHEAKAQWLLQFTQENFPDDVGAETSEPHKISTPSSPSPSPSTVERGNSAKEEAMHLQLLESLSIR